MRYEEYLNEYGSLTYRFRGVSMLPLLRQGRDLIIVKSRDGGYNKGDVVMYRRGPKRHVLHRIIGMRPDGYIIMGDNCTAKEYGIKDEDILGVMTGFIRDGKEYHVSDMPYRAYTCLWLHTIPLRVFLKKTKSFLGKMKSIL